MLVQYLLLYLEVSMPTNILQLTRSLSNASTLVGEAEKKQNKVEGQPSIKSIDDFELLVDLAKIKAPATSPRPIKVAKYAFANALGKLSNSLKLPKKSLEVTPKIAVPDCAKELEAVEILSGAADELSANKHQVKTLSYIPATSASFMAGSFSGVLLGIGCEHTVSLGLGLIGTALLVVGKKQRANAAFHLMSDLVDDLNEQNIQDVKLEAKNSLDKFKDGIMLPSKRKSNMKNLNVLLHGSRDEQASNAL
jgi:hypothetical protein